MKSRAIANQNYTENKIASNLAAKISYFVMCYSWIFDFRSEGAGSSFAVQQFFIITYAIAFLNFAISYRDNGVHIK